MNLMTDFTRPELQRVARAVLRRYCDVRAGAASPGSLAAWLTPAAARSAMQLAIRASDPTVTHARLGPVVLVCADSRRAAAVSPLEPSQEGALSVLMVELEVIGDRLAARRLGELGPEIGRGHSPRASLVGPGQPAPDLPPYAESLVGQPHGEGNALDVWAAATSVIDTYRERYGVTDASSAFGRQPDDREQRLERDRALDYVRAVSHELPAAPARETRPAPGRRGPELGR